MTPLTSEVLAEGKRLRDETERLRKRGSAVCFRAEADENLAVWMLENAPALLAAAEENERLLAEVERLKKCLSVLGYDAYAISAKVEAWLNVKPSTPPDVPQEGDAP